MIWKIILHTGKNPSKAGYWLASVILSILQIAGGAGGRQRSHRKILQFRPSYNICLEAVFPARKLTQNCYLHYNIDIFS